MGVMRLTLFKSRVYFGDAIELSVALGRIQFVSRRYVTVTNVQQKKMVVPRVSEKYHQILKTRWVIYLKAKRL